MQMQNLVDKKELGHSPLCCVNSRHKPSLNGVPTQILPDTTGSRNHQSLFWIWTRIVVTAESHKNHPKTAINFVSVLQHVCCTDACVISCWCCTHEPAHSCNSCKGQPMHQSQPIGTIGTKNHRVLMLIVTNARVELQTCPPQSCFRKRRIRDSWGWIRLCIEILWRSKHGPLCRLHGPCHS